MRTRANLPSGAFADISLEQDIDQRQFITALARGLDVLRAFDPTDGPLGNGEIAAKVGLPKPTISRITYTLSRQGYLEFNPKISKYSLGPSVLALGHSFLDGLVIRQAARDHLTDLAMAVDGAVALGMRDRLSIVYLEMARGPSDRTIRLDVGARLPIYRSASGLAYLAGLSDIERGYMKEAIERERSNEWQMIDDLIARARVEMKSTGFCVGLSIFERGYNSVATNWHAPQGRGYYVVNVTGIASDFPAQRMIDEVGPQLLTAVDNIGHDWLRLIG